MVRRIFTYPCAALLAALILTCPVQAQQSLADAGTARPARGGSDPRQAVPTPPSNDARHEELAPRATAVRRTADITLDGQLDDAGWADAPVISGLWQWQPDEASPAAQRTEVRIVYDDEAIWVAARMYDDHPSDIVGRLARRDAETGSDLILIQFDPYHNHNGDASFSVNPAGTRWDGGNGDESWDPVWQAKTRVDDTGWSAEMRIPFSQLRFVPGSDAEWGFQIERFTNRTNEDAVWSFWNVKDQGGPSRWGHLTGIHTPDHVPGRLELLPYVVSVAELNGRGNDADPFFHDRTGTVRVGGDLKYQVTSNLTLSATVNPDFGQAEVDPAVVNLSAFETFFDEKREFFIEGRDKLSYGGLWCISCSNVSSLSMLHTRRIGRAPQAAGLAYAAGDYADVPSQTTILGAAKLTGRTAAGWNVGVLEAVTGREKADVALGAERFQQEVEPATNYFVGRASRDLEDGNLQLGGIVTSVARDFSDPALRDRLNQHSEGAGLDGEYWFGDHNYHAMAQVALTQISGDPAAILRAQRSSARYFQRPDRGQGSNGLFTDRYDSTLTSMRGYGFYGRVAKDGGNWRWETSLNARSPGFENNDIAFLSRTDFVWMNATMMRRWTQPTSWYRNFNFGTGAQQEFDYDGNLTNRQFSAFVNTTTPFYWGTGAFAFYRPASMNVRATRGGPVVQDADVWYANYRIETDSRKPVTFGIYPEGWTSGDGGHYEAVSLDVGWKPASNVSLSLGPSYGVEHDRAQYVTSVDDPTATDFYGERYVFSNLDQKSLSLNTRLNVTFTPTMSLELFAQPYFSSNDFSEFKEFTRPRDNAYTVYGRDVGTVATRTDDDGTHYDIDPDGAGPAATFTVDNPDFNFRSLRGNAVFRWEYTPGSTLFLVWTQDRFSQADVSDFSFGRDRRALLDAPANHVFLIKMNYWLPL